MESKYQRYTKEIIDRLGEYLLSYKSASEAARDIGIDISGLIKHVKKYRMLKETTDRNKCALKYTCEKKNAACQKCHYLIMYHQEKRCQNCKSNCNDVCQDFTRMPTCERLSKWPYVCNGCKKKDNCRLNKLIYDSDYAWKLLCKNRSEPRKGNHATEAEFIRLSNLLKPLILEKHQSLPQIFLTHKAEIKWSYPTILSFIDQELIPGIKNIDLTKRVKYPASFKKKQNEPTNFAFLNGRTYDDFICYVSENPADEVIEMDTVLSSRGINYCLLTLLFRKSNYMMAFLLKNKTSESVKQVFSYLRKTLGDEMFNKTFKVILTDNGSEFANPIDIEFDENGVRTTRVFYCDPGKSGQKGKIEKNHVELRKIFPKPTDFSIYNQEDINLSLRHINSEPRGILNGNCPGVIAPIFIDKIVLGINNYSFIKPDEVLLHPNLLKK